MIAQLSQLTPAELECLTFFLAERAELWRQYCKDFGVPDPSAVPAVLATSYAQAVAPATKPKKRNWHQ